jgi:hypothetical protein
MSDHTAARALGRALRTLAICAAALAAPGLALGQTQSWVHLQISGIATTPFDVRLTIGSEIYDFPQVPAQATASELAHDLAEEINSARHGHMLHATVNGVDGSILSMVADGSPTPSTTPWLGRLVPAPRISVEPGDCGIDIQRTDIEATIAAINVEGELTAAAPGHLSVDINGKTFTVTINSETEQPRAIPARELAEDLAQIINDDPGFRASLLHDDSGQLRIFITGENLGGGLQMERPPRGVDGVTFAQSSTLFASQRLYGTPD